jgi:hypothetical protein
VSDLPPGLRDFGERLEEVARRDVAERARRRQPRRRRVLRNAGLPVAAAVVAAVVSAGAVRLGDREADSIPAEREGAGYEAAKDSAVVEASAVADPAGGPPWVLRAFTTKNGRQCVQVGRLRKGAFGQVQGDRFRALPSTAPGSACSAPNDSGPLFAVSRRPAVNLTFVFGLAPSSKAVMVSYGKLRRSVRPVGLGAFLTIFEGSSPRQRIVARARVGGQLRGRSFP